MKLNFLSFFLLFFAIQVKAEVTINVVARPAASIFEIMDNVSFWYPGFNDTEYREYWVKNWPLTNRDKKLFGQYKAIREKYYNDPDQDEKDPLKNRNGFFSTLGSLSPDP